MTKNKYTNLLLQTLGCFISAAGIYSFAVAAEVPVTGIAGICAILYRLFGIPMGLSNVLINIPIILCTYKLLGRSFFIRSVYCMVLFAFFTDYLLPLMPVYQGDRLLATICGGVVGGIGDALIKKQEAIILSMTKAERKNPDIIKASRKKRIAAGSGVEVHDVNKLLKQYEQMASMMKKMGRGGGFGGLASMMKNVPFGKFPGGTGNKFPF